MNDFDEASAWRYNMVWSTNPLIRKKQDVPKKSSKLIPIHEKIAILRGQLDTCIDVRDRAVENIKQLEAEIKIWEDDQ